MKAFRRLASPFVTWFLLLLSFDCRALTIVTEQWPPVSFLNAAGKADGLAVEIAGEIQNILGSKEPIHVFPWARGYQMVTTEANVLLFAMAYTDERAKLISMVGPIVQGEIAFFSTSGRQLKIDSLEQAKKYQVGTYRATNFEAFLKKHHFPNTSFTTDPMTGAKKLLADRIDLLVEDSVVIGEILKKIGADRRDVYKSFAAEKTELYFGFSPGTSAKVIQQWNDALAQMKKNGRFQALYKKWLPYEDPPLETRLLLPKK